MAHTGTPGKDSLLRSYAKPLSLITEGDTRQWDLHIYEEAGSEYDQPFQPEVQNEGQYFPGFLQKQNHPYG